VARGKRLSLESVGWGARILGILCALVVAVFMYGPILGVLEFVSTGDTDVLARIPTAFLMGFFLFLWFAVVPSTNAVLLFWIVPALTLNLVALKLRSNFFGFLVAGAFTGIVGFFFLGVASAINSGELNTLLDAWRLLRRVILVSAVPAGITGAIAGAIAWRVMASQLNERGTTAVESKTIAKL
jgi:hypothetical protein